MFYDEEIVQELKQLYNDVDPESKWDFSLSSLRQVSKMNEMLFNMIAYHDSLASDLK